MSAVPCLTSGLLEEPFQEIERQLRPIFRKAPAQNVSIHGQGKQESGSPGKSGPIQAVWSKRGPVDAPAASQSQLTALSHWAVFPRNSPTVSADSTLLKVPSRV